MPGATVFAHSGRDLFYIRANEQSELRRKNALQGPEVLSLQE